MLPNFYKFHIVNNTGVTLAFATTDTFVITAVPWKFDSNGALEYGAEITLFASPAGNLVAGGTLEAIAEIDNTSNKFLGLYARVELFSTASPNGTLDSYWEWSTDGVAGTYPSDSADVDVETDLIPVNFLTMTVAASDRSQNFSL